MNCAQLIPHSPQRDSAGRLIGLVFDSTPPLAATTAQPWLIALDASENALRAITQAAALAKRMNACALHLIHVLPWLAQEAAETGLAHQGLAVTAPARAVLDAAGLPWRLHLAMGEAAERIVEQATELRADCLVIGSRGLGTMESLLFGSVSYKVMHLSRVPVLLVP